MITLRGGVESMEEQQVVRRMLIQRLEVNHGSTYDICCNQITHSRLSYSVTPSHVKSGSVLIVHVSIRIYPLLVN